MEADNAVDVDDLLEDVWQFLHAARFQVEHPNTPWVKELYDNSYNNLLRKVGPVILRNRRRAS